jgi:hypothetical protein
MASEQTFLGVPVVAEITTFDRLIFKGHFAGFGYPRAVLRTLAVLGQVLLKDWAAIIKPLSRTIHEHLETWCQNEGRPFEYLERAHTHRDGDSKELMARRIAERDGIKSGLVCVFRVLEPCSSFDVRGNRETHRLELVRRPRRCLHYYAYLIDPQFGWMHVRIQGWIPFTIQIYINGREWLCRQLDRRGVPYRRSDNKVTAISNLPEVQRQTRRLERMNWPKALDHYARLVNPLIKRFSGRDGKRGYYWVTDQCEYATDLLLRDRTAVDQVMGDLKRHAHTTLAVRDCYRFLGKRESRSEAVIDLKQRPEGWRGKCRLGRNWLKVYDHANIVRFETTINHPAAFTVVRHEDATQATAKRSAKRKPSRSPLRKGVRDFWLLARIARDANQRMIASCDTVRITREAIDRLDRLSQPQTVRGKRLPRIVPTAPDTVALFKAVADGANCLRGFSSSDVRQHLYPTPPADDKERRRRTCRVSRKLSCLRARGLIARIPKSRRYRLTAIGRATIHAVIRFHDLDFPMLSAA